MGKQPELDDEDWDLPDAEALKELSPLPRTGQHGLFQRIVRQREVYFADIEAARDGDEDEDAMDGADSVQDADGMGGQREERLPPSGFADLSTWCCDAFLPARARPAPLEERSSRLISLADQPTMALSLLTSSQVHIADLPTLPNLPAMSAPVSSGALSSGRKLWSVLLLFCWRLLRAWFSGARHAMRARRARPSASKGHELLMQRLREREQRGASARALSTLSGEQHSHQVRLPADRLFR